MTDTEIIKNWKIGFNIKYIANKYKEDEDRSRKTVGIKNITQEESYAYVEKVIFKYQTDLFKES